MNRWWLPGLLMLMCNFVAAQVQWDGDAGDGLWSTAENWTNNSVPLPNDTVILNNVYVTIDYTVTLPAGSISITIQSIIITPDASRRISLVLPSTNISNPGLAISSTGD